MSVIRSFWLLNDPEPVLPLPEQQRLSVTFGGGCVTASNQPVSIYIDGRKLAEAILPQIGWHNTQEVVVQSDGQTIFSGVVTD